MKLSCIAFTKQGLILGERLCRLLSADNNALSLAAGGKQAAKLLPYISNDKGQFTLEKQSVSVKEWTKGCFYESDALIFIGAAGIAVRAIAPYIQSKTKDPAVLVLDEKGSYVIPILSGHIGQANAIAVQIGRLLQAVPVITTATDINQVFAIDSFAVEQGLRLVHTGNIKKISARLLAGETAGLYSEFPVIGSLPEGMACCGALKDSQAAVTIRTCKRKEILYLVPPIVTIGIGCKKGTPSEAIEQLFKQLLEQYQIAKEAVCQASSIDLKAKEPGLLDFCRKRGLPLYTFGAEELAAVDGVFTPSLFVASVTGVDNVCERSAVLASGGSLLFQKASLNGVTMAFAKRDYTLQFGDGIE